MGATNAVIQFGTMKLNQIVEISKGKPIPNWWKVGDVQGFGIRINEGDLNFMITCAVFPVEEAGAGNFLIKLQSTFISNPIGAEGFEFLPMPIGQILELDYTMYSEDEQELQDGILQLIADEAENILCQILQ